MKTRTGDKVAMTVMSVVLATSCIMVYGCNEEEIAGEPIGAADAALEITDRAFDAKAVYIEPEPEYYEEPYYEYYEEPVYYGGGGYNNSFQSEGVRYDGDTRYTWYSQNVLPGGGLTELNNNGRHVDGETGFIMDGDGYIAVASSDYPQGTIVSTPWGEAKVYDSGCSHGTIDVYTDF